MKKIKVALLPFPKLPTFSNHSDSMVTESQSNHAFEGNHYTHVIADLYTGYIVIVPSPKNIATSLLHLWIAKNSPVQRLITVRVTEHLNAEKANCCTWLEIHQSPRTSHAP